MLSTGREPLEGAEPAGKKWVGGLQRLSTLVLKGHAGGFDGFSG